MPIYSYHCTKCGHDFEMLVGVTAESTELKCEKCGSTQVKKNLSACAMRMGSTRSNTSSCATGTCCPTC